MKRNIRPGEEVIVRQVYRNIRRGLSQVSFHLPQNTQVVLCAGGVSLKDNLKDIAELQKNGAKVVCVGNTANTLYKEGIKVNAHIMLDGVERNKSFIFPRQGCKYLVASQCHPKVFDALKGYDVYIWHCGSIEEEKDVLNSWYGKGNWFQIIGGSFVTLRAISLLQVLGYKWMHLFGFDSCLIQDEHHAYIQESANGQKVFEVEIGGRKFQANAWMLDQASQFVDSVREGRFGDAELAIHGDGLIAHMVKTGSTPTWQLQ